MESSQHKVEQAVPLRQNRFMEKGKRFTIITGHGKIEFLKKADGKLELLSVERKALSLDLKKTKTGELGENRVRQQ